MLVVPVQVDPTIANSTFPSTYSIHRSPDVLYSRALPARSGGPGHSKYTFPLHRFPLHLCIPARGCSFLLSLRVQVDPAILGLMSSGKGRVAVYGDSNCLDSSHMVRHESSSYPWVLAP